MEVSVDKKCGFITARLTGPQTRQSFEAGFDDLVKHPDFDFSLNRLWDAREAGLKDLSESDLRLIQRFVQERVGSVDPVRVAVVAPKDIDYGICNMFRLMTESELPVDIRIYRELDEAVAWVSVETNRPKTESSENNQLAPRVE